MIKNLPLNIRLLCIPAFLCGPFMALFPRGMMAVVIYTTLILLPSLKRHWDEIKTSLHRQSILLMAVALLYTCASAVWSPNMSAPRTAFDIFYLTACCAVIFLTLPFVKTEPLHTLIDMFIAGWATGLLFLGFEMSFDHPIHRWVHHMDAATPVNENVPKRMAALFALSIWPIALWLRAKGRRIVSYVAVIGFLSLSFLLTNRSSLLAMVVGTAVLFFATYQPMLARWALVVLMGLGCFFIVPISTLLPQLPHEVTGQLFDSALARIKIWTFTSQHILEAPIIGHGIDASKGLLTDAGDGQGFFQPGVSAVSHHPHNIFLQLWLDFGLIGTLLWGGLMLLLTYRIYRAHEMAQPYILAAAFCSLTMLNTTFSLLQAWWLSGHIVVAVMLALLSYSLSRSAATSGTSAGGISNS